MGNFVHEIVFMNGWELLLIGYLFGISNTTAIGLLLLRKSAK